MIVRSPQPPITAAEVAAQLARLARIWPIGCSMHDDRTGRDVTVRLDEAVHVPGRTADPGRPAAHCVLPSGRGAVCLTWIDDGVPYLGWALADELGVPQHRRSR